MSSKPIPEEKGKKMPKSPIEWVFGTFNLRKPRSKSEENLRQVPQQKPNLQSKNKSQHENLKDRRNQERTSRTLNSNYKYIIQKDNTKTAQTKSTEIEEKELIKKYGHMSVPVITHILKKNEEKQRTGEKKRFADQRYVYPPNLVSNDTMPFNLNAWAKIVKYMGLKVNKYTGKGQTLRNFIRNFEDITEPISESMYNQTIWHFIDEKQKERISIEDIGEIDSRTFLAQLFLVYEFCPPTKTAIRKKLEKLDFHSMSIVEAYYAIKKICGELPRDMEYLKDELVFEALEEAVPAPLRHLFKALKFPTQGFPKQEELIHFLCQNKEDIDEINEQDQQRKNERNTKQPNPQPHTRVYNIYSNYKQEEEKDPKPKYPAKQNQNQHSVSKN